MHSWGAKQTNRKEMYYLTAINFAKWAIALDTKTGVYHFVNTKAQSQHQLGYVWYHLKIVSIQRNYEHFLLNETKTRNIGFGEIGMKL